MLETLIDQYNNIDRLILRAAAATGETPAETICLIRATLGSFSSHVLLLNFNSK
jgi:hypothetical protein